MGRLGYVTLTVVFLAGIFLGGFAAQPRGTRQATPEPVKVGFTFSERQAGYLDVSWRQAFEAAMDLTPNLVRLGAYWDTIETAPGQYDFSDLDWMLDNMPQESSVLLTVGMKAPRWPEFFLPAWLRTEVKTPDGGDAAQDPRVREATLRFISEVVRHTRGRANITYWQVENEPLDPSGPRNWYIDPAFLADEISLVRSLDAGRPIVVSMFVDTSPLELLPPWHGQLRDRARSLVSLGDVLGLDVYPVRPIANSWIQISLKWPVWVWESRVRELQRLAQTAGKQTWISEAQAEPWLPARLAHTDSAPAHYAAPGLTARTVDRLHADGFNTILLWGVEYWYMRAERYEDGNWWTGMQRLFRKSYSQIGSSRSA